jgi:hypothetical protein
MKEGKIITVLYIRRLAPLFERNCYFGLTPLDRLHESGGILDKMEKINLAS